jgi:thioredoxin 1
MPIVHASSDGDLDRIFKEAGQKLVIVNFSATWCGPCKAFAPTYERMSSEFSDVVFVKVMENEARELVLSRGKSWQTVCNLPVLVLVCP